MQDRRQMEEWVRKRNEERQGQREVIAQKCQRIVTDRERELRERERKLMQEIQRHKEEVREKEEKKLEAMFLLDLEREKEKKDIKGKYMSQRMVRLLCILNLRLSIERAIGNHPSTSPFPEETEQG